MLHIYFGHREDALVGISNYFDLVFEDEWMATELTKRMILDVDKSTVLYPRVIDSPVLGPISPRELSGGVKGLILMAYDDDMLGSYFYGEQFGDNTAKWILEIAKNRDIYITLNHFMEFDRNFKQDVYIDNTDEIINSYDEYFDVYFEIRKDIPRRSKGGTNR